MTRLFHGIRMFAAAVALGACVWVAHAFPPAPGIVVYGVVKDTEGNTVGGANAFVVFKSGGVEIARSLLRDGLSEGESYRALLPADMGGGEDSYRDEVLDTAVPFTVEVVIGGQVFEPIESSRGIESPAEAGAAIRFDFSLGTDSDGDGLPDEWEFGQLRISGVGPGDELYNLDQFSQDGDYDEDGLSDRDEYLAGTFAYLGFDAFAFELVSFSEDGGMEVRFLGVRGRRYAFEGSTNLLNWQEVAFQDRHQMLTYEVFEPTNTRVFTMSIPAETVKAWGYFRIRVQ